MLNIPEEVKTLFKADSIFKNFHVHFPNGEYTDLNNDDIVSESVEFTESLCSQQAFRFGLTEASEIKFTCVNVPNIRGAVIECAIEVQADSLGAEWLADNAPTGNEEFLDPQVCVYGSRNMYRVPYGRFIVDTCPRNHETMYKRDVTGYTNRTETDSITNNFLVAMMNGIYPQATAYKPYLKPLTYSVIFSGDHSALARNGYTAGEPDSPTSSGGITMTNVINAKFDNGTAVQLHYSTYATGAGMPVLDDAEGAKTNLYGVTIEPISEDVWMAGAVANLEELHINAELSGYESLEDIVRAGIAGFNEAKSYIAHNRYIDVSGQHYIWTQSIPVPTESGIVYPYGIDIKNPDDINYASIYMQSGFTVQTGARSYSTRTANVTFTKYTDTDEAGTIAAGQIAFNPTLSTNIAITVGGNRINYPGKGFADAFSPHDIAQGYLELQCRFGSPARTGGMEITALDNTSPVSILPENYAELWYDETTIAPIGYVQVKFKDETDNEQDLTVQIGTGASVYDLRDNAVLQNMVFTVSKAEAEAGITIESKLLAFLNSVFTPNIPDLTFIPIELTKKGLPYLEAGDAVTITTGDGQVVPSFILRQTVKGIQFLTADVESANGEAVEMVDV